MASWFGGATTPLGFEMTKPTPQAEHTGNPGLGGREAVWASADLQRVATATREVKKRIFSSVYKKV